MKPKYTKVSDYVMEKITNGDWPVGHMLPTEMELCEQFGVSRPSVRTALLGLVNEGFLVRTKGKGTFVTTPSRLEESTVFIESFAYEMQKRGLAIQTEVLEFRVMVPEEYILAALKQPENSSVVKLTRLRYTMGSFEEGPIVLTTSYFPEKVLFLQNYDFSSTSVHKALDEHGIARKFIEKHIGIAFLDSRESRLMGVPFESPAICITSFTQDEDGDFIEYCESRYPADRNQFILKLRL